MSTKVIMPQMGESIFEGTITKWLKKVGEKVNRDEPLFEISTDKVDSEIPAPAGGVLSQILVPEGQTVQINTVVAVIEAEGASTPKVVETEEKSTGAVAVSKAGAALGAKPVAESTAVPKPAPAVSEGLRAETTVAPVPVAAPKLEPAGPPRPVVQPRDIRTSPLVRRLAREHNIDLSEVRGSGIEGRISKEDLLSYIQSRGQAPQPAPEAKFAEPLPEEAPAVEAARETGSPSVPAPAPAAEMPRFAGETEVVPMSPMRKQIAEHMVMSKRTSAHVGTVFEIDMTAIVGLREKYKDNFEKKEGVKLTFTPFIVKALVDTVREFPILNCSVSGDNIIYKKQINVGVAVALEAGLIVPVVRDAHLKSFTGLALAINDLAQRARTKRLKPEDVQNGTISITNPGIYGSLFGTPIISQPQVAILGVGGIEKRPVVINDAIAIRSMMYLSLSFDHRVIDGAVADQFMASLKARLQSWTQWVE